MKRPPLAATALTALMLAVLLALGFWQLQRRAWKADLLARLEGNVQAPATDLPAFATPASEFSRVRVDCRWVGATVRLPGSGPRGRAGERLYQACAPAGGGVPVLVDLGFTPMGQAAPGRPQGMVIAAVRLWPRLSLVERMSGARRVGPDTLAGDRDFFLQLAAPQAPQAPQPYPLSPADLPNNHLSYAIQWFSFAAILLLVYGVFLLRGRRRSLNGQA